MNIVLITTLRRPDLYYQTLSSLIHNAADWPSHTLTLVFDAAGEVVVPASTQSGRGATHIVNPVQCGASASRNIGASSIPTYRRQKYVMFSDDDCYYVKGWDKAIEHALFAFPGSVVSGHAHPFNHSIGSYVQGINLSDYDGLYGVRVDAAGVLSTVNMAMPWEIWDAVGMFVEPGGPGGSEDVEWCKRETDKGYGLAVTVPQCVIHTGLTSSRGEPIVGADMVRERNRELETIHNIIGQVVYS